MDSFINSSLPIWGYILILVLIFGCAFLWEYKTKKENPEKESKYFEMNEKPLTSQTLFWLAIIIPFASFGYFGYFSWYGKPFLFNAEGFERFIKVSALPLGLLSLSIPFSAIVNNIHRTIQTNKQIVESLVKNNTDSFYTHQKYFIDYIRSISPIPSIKKYTFNIFYKENASSSKENRVIEQVVSVNVSVVDYYKFYYYLYDKTTVNLSNHEISKRNVERVKLILETINGIYGIHLGQRKTTIDYRKRIKTMFELNEYINLLFNVVGIKNKSEILYDQSVFHGASNDKGKPIKSAGNNAFFNEKNNTSYIRVIDSSSKDRSFLITDIYSDSMYFILLSRFIDIFNNALQLSRHEIIDMSDYNNIGRFSMGTNNLSGIGYELFSIIKFENFCYCSSSTENSISLVIEDDHKVSM